MDYFFALDLFIITIYLGFNNQLKTDFMY